MQSSAHRVKSKSHRRAIAQYQGRPLSWRDFWGWYLPGLLVPLGLTGYGAWRTYVGYQQYGPVPGNLWGRPWFIGAAVALIPVLLLALRHFHARREKVILYGTGLRLFNISTEHYGLSWSRISGIATHITRYTFFGRPLLARCRVVIFPTVGAPIRLDGHMQNLPELAQQIKDRLYPVLLPGMRSQLREGKQLFFGPVKITRREVVAGSRSIPWKEVNLIEIRAGKLVIELKKRGKIQTPTSKIPNVELLIRLIAEEIVS